MPSGRTHAAITSVAAVTEVILGLPYVAIGSALGLVITPDLDVDAVRAPDNIVYALYGPLAKRLWRAFWMPYSKAMPHRSLRSHWPVISTVIRLAYIFAWPVSVFIVGYTAIAGYAGLPAVGWVNILVAIASMAYHSCEVRQVIFGLIVADTLHFVADILVSEVRLWMPKKPRKHYRKSKKRSRRR